MATDSFVRAWAVISFIALVRITTFAQTPGTEFTYQGRLETAGVPATGSHDLRFRLWTSENDPNSPFGPVICKDNVNISDGLFTTQLDFGMNVLVGFPLWLGIEVRTDSTPGNCANGSYTLLSPRQPLKPTPYAVWAASAQTAGLRLPFDGTATSGILLHLTNTSNGTSTSTGFFENYSVGNNSRAVTAYANGNTGSTYAIYAQNSSASGVGVYGRSSGTAGVHGDAVSTAGPSYGVFGASASTSGRGLYGLASAGSGTTFGVFAQSDSSTGYGGYFIGSRNYFSGHVGIGTSSPNSPLDVRASISGLGTVMHVLNNNTGSAASFESLGAGSAPAVNCFKENGTALLVTSDSSSTSAPLVVTGGMDSAPSGGGFIVAGSTNGTNVSIDDNEIMARNNGSTSDLSLNHSGGNLILNGLAGNTGVGTTSPTYKLDVNGGVRPRAGVYFNGALPPIPEAQGGNFLSFGHPGRSEDQMFYFDNAFTYWDSPGGGDTTHPDLRAADFITISDIRLKTDIQPLIGALDRVRRLRGIEYRFDGHKVDPQADAVGPPDRKRLGFAAQEVQEAVPEAVSYSVELDVYGVSHGTLVPLLVESIKEQQLQIEALRAEIAAIRESLEASKGLQ